MGIHWGRLTIVLGVSAVIVGAGYAVYSVVDRNVNRSANLTASAEQYLADGDYASADVEIEKLLRIEPNAGKPHFLKAQALLKGREISDLGPADPDGVSAIQSLVRAVSNDPGLLPARRMLVAYFLNSGDVESAGDQARRIIERDPTDPEARYAVAASLARSKAVEALPIVDEILAEESPARPRSIWLAAQVGDSIRDRADLVERAEKWLAEHGAEESPSISDRLALVELRLWKANRSNDPEAFEAQVRASMDELRKLTVDLSATHLSPRLILRTASRLLPAPNRRRPQLEGTYARLEPEIESFLDEVFLAAKEAKTLDPALYTGQARRLRARGMSDEAVTLLKGALATAAEQGEQTRLLFVDADLWLAEYYLDEGQGELAEPYIETLLAHPVVRPAGEMLAGYRLMQQGKFHEASARLASALPKLSNNGAAHALFGLCQLRRGMISEGREHLEQGISLGASSPRYQAWLALALAEGGYQDQAMVVAKQLLESPDNAVLGRALIGQLRLQAGDFSRAQEDLKSAYENADEEFKPAIRLAEAELALAQANPEQAVAMFEEIKTSPLGDRAFALHYRYLRDHDQGDQATKVLAEGRTRFPKSTLLLATDVRRLLEAERFDDATALLEAERASDPTAMAPIMLLTEVYEEAKSPEKGIALLEKTAEEMPGEPSLRIRLAEKLLTARDFVRTAELLEQMRRDTLFNPTTIDYLSARLAAQQGDMATAQEYIEKAAERDPDNPTLKFLRGQLAAQKGDYSTATEMFEQSLAAGDHRQQAVQALFESLLRQGETNRAVEVLSRAEKRGQEVRSLRVQLLGLLARQENWGALENEIAAILSENPTEEDYLLVISAFRYVRQPQRAVEQVARALKAFPDSMALQEQEASLLIELGNFKEARPRLDRLVAAQPTNAMLQVLRIFILEQSGESDRARSAIESAWERCPGHPAIAALMVQSLLRADLPEQAIDFAEKAKRQHPELPDPRYLVARMHESLGNTDKALALLKVLTAEDPKNPRAAESYFRLIVETRLPKDVEPAVESLLAAQPDNPLLAGALAEYRALQGDLAGADAMIQKLDHINSAGSMVSYTKAMLAFAKREFKEAERLAYIAAADPRGHVPATFLLARIRAAQGKYTDAVDFARRVCRQQPRNGTAHLFLGRLLGETGDWPEAEKVIRAFLVEQPADRSMKLLLARALLARGGNVRAKEAAEIAWKVFEEGIRGGEELEAVMNVLFAAGQSDKCREIIASFESRGPMPENVLAAGRASFIAGDHATAARLADQVLVAQPKNVDALMLAADTEARLGNVTEDDEHFEKAVALYQRILAEDPKNQPAANNLAWTLGVSLGKEVPALEHLLRVVPAATDPSPLVSLDILDTVGTLYLRLERMEQAQAHFEAILQRDPSNAMATYRLGQIFDRQGRADRAEQAFTAARKLAPTENWEQHKIDAGFGN